MKLSVLVPVYNENRTIHKVLDLIHEVPVEKEVIVVDDGSTDSTLKIIRHDLPHLEGFRLIAHKKNRGKGDAVRAGIREANGEHIIIQDADLEYDPMDYLPLLSAMERSGANVVYGSRFLKKNAGSSLFHRTVNGFLTMLTNILYGSKLTDMETCYKLFKASLLKSLPLRSNGFELEVELTARILKRGERIVEVPVSYRGRSHHEGKKIGWKDGVKAVIALFRYRFFQA